MGAHVRAVPVGGAHGVSLLMAPSTRARAATNRSLVARSRTAMRSQPGPRPGNVSPRRTAKPASRNPFADVGATAGPVEPEAAATPVGRAAPAVASTPRADAGRADRILIKIKEARAPGVTNRPGSSPSRRTRWSRSTARPAGPGRRLGMARGSQQATTAARAGVDTAQCGCSRASNSRRPGGRAVTDPQSRQAPGPGQAAHHDQAGQVARPARRSASPGTQSMNASSTTSVRPGRASAAIVPAGCRTEVGLVGLPT